MSGTDKLIFTPEKQIKNRNNCESIIEIPPTIGFLQSHSLLCYKVKLFLSRNPYNKFRILNLLNRLHLLNFRWLSPETSTLDDMIKLSDILISKGHRFLNMFFHSTSLLPGCSPFVHDKSDLNNFIRKIDCYLKHMSDNGVNCIGLSRGLRVLKGQEQRDYQRVKI